jgi:hypothetical protein
MHDPVPQTGKWLRSLRQGHFNYYAVPGNVDSLSTFLGRVRGLWWHVLRRRSQKHRLNCSRMLVMAERWLPRPCVLHLYPVQRFAARHLR